MLQQLTYLQGEICIRKLYKLELSMKIESFHEKSFVKFTAGNLIEPFLKRFNSVKSASQRLEIVILWKTIFFKLIFNNSIYVQGKLEKFQKCRNNLISNIF